jgi:hypothetical protein
LHPQQAKGYLACYNLKSYLTSKAAASLLCSKEAESYLQLKQLWCYLSSKAASGYLHVRQQQGHIASKATSGYLARKLLQGYLALNEGVVVATFHLDSSCRATLHLKQLLCQLCSRAFSALSVMGLKLIKVKFKLTFIRESF